MRHSLALSGPKPPDENRRTVSATLPIVQINGVGGSLTRKRRQEMIRKVTDAVHSVDGERLRPVTWVTIEDIRPGAWGGGGQPATDEDLRSLAQKKAAA